MEPKKVYAKSKYIRRSPQKVRLVIDTIRGQKALFASEMLQFLNKGAARPVRKTLESAIANAIENEDMDKEQLTVVEARVDEAPIFKRGRAVSKGRYHKILKRNSHIIIAVSDGSSEDKKAKEKKTSDAKKAKATKAKAKDIKKEAITETEKTVIDKKIQRQTQVKAGQRQRKVQAKG